MIGKQFFVALAALCVASPAVAQDAVSDRPPAPPTSDDVEQWAIANLQDGTWGSWSFASDNTIYYTRTAKSVDGHPRMWIRWEDQVRKNEHDPKSGAYLDEFDCKEGKVRIIQTELYREQNLKDPLPDNDIGKDSWSYVIPGSLAESTEQAVCTRYAAKPRKSASHHPH